jgi:hypothetical protein
MQTTNPCSRVQISTGDRRPATGNNGGDEVAKLQRTNLDLQLHTDTSPQPTQAGYSGGEESGRPGKRPRTLKVESSGRGELYFLYNLVMPHSDFKAIPS